MILIVFSHSFPDRIVGPKQIYNSVPYIQSAGLTLFMCVSGFLFERTKQIDKYGGTGVLKHRAERLLIPYFAIQLLMILPKSAIGIVLNTKIEMTLALLVHSFLYPREGILPHLWFLPTLFWISALCCIIYPWMKRKANWIAVIVLSGVMSLCNPDVDLLGIADVSSYFIWFLLGMIAANYKLERYLQHKNLFILISSGGYMLCLLMNTGNAFLNGVVLLIRSLCSIVLILTISVLLEQIFTDQVWLWIGKYTFTIYILSLPVQNIIEIIFMIIGTGWITDMIGMFLAGIFIPLIVGICVGGIEKKLKTRWISKIIGLA